LHTAPYNAVTSADRSRTSRLGTYQARLLLQTEQWIS
jgi:hypothetical protein